MTTLKILNFDLNPEGLFTSAQCNISTSTNYQTFSIKDCTTIDCTTIQCTTIDCTTIQCTEVKCSRCYTYCSDCSNDSGGRDD